jgi:hypothetical protein
MNSEIYLWFYVLFLCWPFNEKHYLIDALFGLISLIISFLFLTFIYNWNQIIYLFLYCLIGLGINLLNQVLKKWLYFYFVNLKKELIKEIYVTSYIPTEYQNKIIRDMPTQSWHHRELDSQFNQENSNAILLLLLSTGIYCLFSNSTFPPGFIIGIWAKVFISLLFAPSVTEFALMITSLLVLLASNVESYELIFIPVASVLTIVFNLFFHVWEIKTRI